MFHALRETMSANFYGRVKSYISANPFTTSLIAVLSLATVSLSACTPAQPPAPKAPEGFVNGKKVDPELAKVKADAQANWKEFVEAFNVKQKGEKFAINSCLYDDKKSEFKWIEVDKVYDDRVVGHLEKDSVYLPNVKAGMAVTVPVADIEDWAFVDAKGNQHGGASQAILQKRAEK